MEKSFFIAVVFIILIVSLAVLSSHRSDGVQKPTNTTTTTSSTNSIMIVLTNTTRTVTTATATESSTTSQYNGNKTTINTSILNYSAIFTSFVLSKSQTGSHNTSVLMKTANGTYYMVLHGLFNYPTAFFTSNSMMVLMIEAKVVFTNGSTGNLYIPVFQIVKLNSTKSSVPFTLVLYGNSPILAQDYDILTTLKKNGIYSVNIMYITEEGYMVEGVMYI